MAQAYGTITLTDISDGAPGINTAIVNLYQRAATIPSSFETTLTYDFTTGQLLDFDNTDGWQTTIPGTDGNPCWMVSGLAIGNGTTADIAYWESPIKFIEDGAPGEPGAPGVQGVSITKVTNQYIYSDSPNELISSSGTDVWSYEMPIFNPDRYLWIRQEIIFSTGDFDYTNPIHDIEFDSTTGRIAEVQEYASSLNSELSSLSSAVTSQAQAVDSLHNNINGVRDEMGSMGSTISGLNSAINSINSSYALLSTSIAKLSDNLTTELSALNSTDEDIKATIASVSRILETYNEYITPASQWFSFTASEGMYIGAASNSYRTHITNNMLAFEGDRRVAYISPDMFYMVNGAIDTDGGTFTKGHYQEQVKSDGGVFIAYIGGNS